MKRGRRRNGRAAVEVAAGAVDTAAAEAAGVVATVVEVAADAAVAVVEKAGTAAVVEIAATVVIAGKVALSW
jgi:hypothetical protein